MADQFFNLSGRLVQGSVFEPQTTDMNGRPMTDMSGNPKVQYFIGVAVAKDAQDLGVAYGGIQAAAMAGFPGGESQRPDFAWKFVDGDDPKHAGKEGFPGHWVFRFTSGYALRAVTQGGARPIVDPQEIKRGYYVRVFFTCVGNRNAQKPGVYLNGSIIELLGYGPEIVSGPDAAGLIGSAGAAYMPAGVQQTPLAPAPAPGLPAAPAPGLPAAPAPGLPAAPAPGLPAAPAPGLPAAPAPGVIPPHPGILNPQAPAPGLPPQAPMGQPGPAALPSGTFPGVV